MGEFERLYRFHERVLLRIDKKLPRNRSAVNVLPPVDVPLTPYFQTRIPKDFKLEREHKRGKFEDQREILRYNYRGRLEILALHMLTISYLRRQTPYRDHAWAIFTRIWEEHGEELLKIIRTRDLISALRTFADQSPDEAVRLRAKLAFTYGTLIKAYESERMAENRDPYKADYEYPVKVRMLKIPSLYGINFLPDNSLEIINVLMMEEVEEDPVVGAMILVLLERISRGATIFSRADHARLDADCETDLDMGWSFGFNPKEALDEGSGEA